MVLSSQCLLFAGLSVPLCHPSHWHLLQLASFNAGTSSPTDCIQEVNLATLSSPTFPELGRRKGREEKNPPCSSPECPPHQTSPEPCFFCGSGRSAKSTSLGKSTHNQEQAHTHTPEHTHSRVRKHTHIHTHQKPLHHRYPHLQ